MIEITQKNKKIIKYLTLVISLIYTFSLKFDAGLSGGLTRYQIFFSALAAVLIIILLAGDLYFFIRDDEKNRKSFDRSLFTGGWLFLLITLFFNIKSLQVLEPVFHIYLSLAFTFLNIYVAFFYFILSVAYNYLAYVYIPWERAYFNFLSFTTFAVLFSAMGYLLRKERSEKKEYKSKLKDIKEGAKRIFKEEEDAILALKTEKREESFSHSYKIFEERIFDILERIKNFLDPYTVCFVKIKDDGKYYRIVDAISENEYLRYNEDISLEQGVVGWIYKYAKELNLKDYKGSKDSLNYYDRYVPVKSFLGVPVYLNETVFGVLFIDALESDIFTRETENIIRISATQIEDAIQNARLFQQVNQQSKEFKALYDASKVMLSYVKLSETLEGFLELLTPFVNPSYAFISFKDEEGFQKVVIQKGFPGDISGLTISEESLISWSINHKTVLDIKDYGDKKRKVPLINEDVKIKNIDRLIVIPILIEREDRQGALVLCFKDNGPTEYEKNLIEILTNQLTISIAKALYVEKIDLMATTDGLTGVYNHRYFQERFTELLEKGKRYNETFSLILLDIDFFKKVNDNYGHPVGDLVLKKVSQTVKNGARKIDIVARYGGEEFAVILPQISKDNAYKFAERLRKEISELTIVFEGGRLNVTVSMGIATFPEDGNEKAELIEKADNCLYEAKRSGRNRVVKAGDIK